MNIRSKMVAGLICLSEVLPAKAQQTAEVVAHSPLVENVANDSAKVGNKIAKDISIRTFHFPITGNNFTALGFGLGKNYKKTSVYVSPLAGYDFGNKRPMFGGFGVVERMYGNNPDKKIHVGQELYGEVSVAKDFFDSKVAYTPLMFKTKISKRVNLSFDPRFAVHINGEGLSPKFETLTTFSGPINKKTSWYGLFQTYDVRDMKNNIGVNAGIVRSF